MRRESSRLRKAQELIEVEIGVGVDHAGDNAVIHRLFGVHPEVAIGVLLHLLHRLAGSVSNHAIHTLKGTDNLFGFDFDIARLTTHATQRLVDHKAGVWQRVAVLFFSPRGRW